MRQRLARSQSISSRFMHILMWRAIPSVAYRRSDVVAYHNQSHNPRLKRPFSQMPTAPPQSLLHPSDNVINTALSGCAVSYVSAHSSDVRAAIVRVAADRIHPHSANPSAHRGAYIPYASRIGHIYTAPRSLYRVSVVSRHHIRATSPYIRTSPGSPLPMCGVFPARRAMPRDAGSA